MRVVMSVPWSSPWLESPAVTDLPGVQTLARAKDWNPTRWDRIRQTVSNAWRLWRATKGADAVIVCTATLDAIGASIAMRLRPRVTLAVWDFQTPRGDAVRRLARVSMRRVDVWTVLRRSDIETHTQLGARDVAFVPFAAFGAELDTADKGFVYSAGTAHRDWPTLLAAARQLNARIVISTIDHIDVPGELADRVEVRDLVNPAAGRQLCADATVVCVPFTVTELPSGPSVVVDAMALGKAVVVTDVGGTRDYVIDGVTGRLVPPGDAAALAAALRALLDEPDERTRLGAAAMSYARTDLAPAVVLEQLVQLVSADARSGRSGRAGRGR